MEIRSTIISYTKGKRKLLNKRELEIKETLDNLDDIICNSDDLQNIDQDLKLYEELRSLYERKGKEVLFRSKCRWIEKGERPTKYFFNLEKRNYNKKTISELELDNGELLTEEKLILQEIESYYKDLYTSKVSATLSDFDQFSQNLEIPHLSNDERDRLEGPLSFDECKQILNSFSNGKSPGEDGLTVEFYQKFFDILGEDLVDCLNASHEAGQLSISQRRGVITLIPKEEESLVTLKNWRPITLLNVD